MEKEGWEEMEEGVAGLPKPVQRLLNELQFAFPLDPHPYQTLASRLAWPEEAVLEAIRRLKKQQILNRIAAVFDTRALGYQSCLAAARVAQDRLDRAIRTINGHPGVTHNYGRSGPFSLWFTLAVPPGCDMARHVDILWRLSGAESIRLLPALRIFKIGLKLDATGGQYALPSPEGEISSPAQPGPAHPLKASDVAWVRALQEDLPLDPAPFRLVAGKMGESEDGLLAWCRRAAANGWLRRLGGLLNHRRAGFRANGMGIFAVPAGRVDEVAALLAAAPAVTHCYERPVFPDWPYNLFAMLHAQREEEGRAALEALARQAHVAHYDILFSTAEFKKVRMIYFDGRIEAWERSMLPQGAAEGAERGK